MAKDLAPTNDLASPAKPLVLIIGAGPAGLTAALELARGGRFHPLVLEADTQVGGISRTVNYKGNRIDIGGHRFFSKSDWVMRWWQSILPIDSATAPAEGFAIHYQNKSCPVSAHTPISDPDAVMLVRPRLSRIYYEGNFYDYPIKLNLRTLVNLGPSRIIRIAFSYAASILRKRPEKNLEDFLINRFGTELYRTFFHSYTEKVWGVPCTSISPEWGAQRIKGLSIGKALLHFLSTPFRKNSLVDQKNNQTSLIERFLYPKYGPGQMWEAAAASVIAMGGELRLGQRVTALQHLDGSIRRVTVKDVTSGSESVIEPDYVISTMPVRDLIMGMSPEAPPDIKRLAKGLPYRDFLTVGLLLSRMRPNVQSGSSTLNNMPPDNWIYIQDPGVRLGRLQIFNNWSPAMVANPDTVWLGLEYFCNEGDEVWTLADSALVELGARELAHIGLIDQQDVLDGVVIRMPKAYPAYFGTYPEFRQLRCFLDGFNNLYMVGRNGMHRYNNQDHSMLAARACVEAIHSGSANRNAIWDVNTEDDYHEESQKTKI